MTLNTSHLTVAGGPSMGLNQITNAILIGSGNVSMDASEYSGNAVLYCLGSGANTLKGGSGRTILIGGRGSDTLVAGTGATLLIGGYTDLNGDLNKVAEALADWRDRDTYSQFNSTTVHDDKAIDNMTGLNDLDAFFIQSAVAHKASLDLVTGTGNQINSAPN